MNRLRHALDHFEITARNGRVLVESAAPYDLRYHLSVSGPLMSTREYVLLALLADARQALLANTRGGRL
jgi:hypothetical protein